MESNFKINLDTAEYYQWADGCDGWHLLKSDNLTVIRERMAPGTAERLHYHNHAHQVFYILAGEACFEMDGKEELVNSGESIHVPPNATHRISNRTEADLHFLVISSPKAHGDRVNIPQ